MRWIHTLTFLVAIILLAACGPRRAEVEPARPTITPVPTFTTTPVGASMASGGGQTDQQVQVQPAATTAPPTETPIPQPMAKVGTLMNVRGGPGTNYNIIGTASPGEEYLITGKNPGLGDWWQIDYQGLPGWVYGPLVNPANAGGVQVAAVIPAPPPPTATPIPPPTPVPAPTQPPAPRYPYSLTNEGNCPRNDEVTYFEGAMYDRNNNLKNNVCVHIAFYGPRNTKCSGCGKPAGKWGFAPFTPKANPGTYVEIWVVNCPAGVRTDQSHNSQDFSNLAPLSEKWTKALSESVGCNDITFREN